MSPSDRRLYDLIRAMGTPTGKQLHDRLGMQYDYLAINRVAGRWLLAAATVSAEKEAHK